MAMAGLQHKGKYTDEQFEEIMSYVSARVDGEGVKVKVNSQQDLRKLMEALNREEEKRGKTPRLSQEFIDGVLKTGAAQHKVGTTIGHFGRTVNLPGSHETTVSVPSKVSSLKAQRREVFSYSGGYAVKSVTGKRVMFRDTKTGRFVSKKNRFEEA